MKTTIREQILKKIEACKKIAEPVTEDMNLYTDLYLDSLSFIKLLTEIEEEFQVQIPLDQMQGCLEVGRFICLTEKRVKEKKENDQKSSAASGI